LEKFIERYPNSPLALNAQSRLDLLERAAHEREEKARVERESAQQRAAQERRAKEAAQQRAEDEKRAKEAARIAELRAENERRAKQATESEAQKKEQAARIAAAQVEIDRRAKELAESDRQKVDLACKDEQSRLDDLKAAGNSASARDDLKQFSQDLKCERLRPQVVAALDSATSEAKKSEAPPQPPENTAELVASAQKELTRLGCYSGRSNGKLDADTKVAVKKYQMQMDEPVNHVSVTSDFVDELRKRKLRVCPTTVVDRPASEPRRKATSTERSKSSKSESRPAARQQAKGASHPMIGIGF
jgi:hypothetical protein